MLEQALGNGDRFVVVDVETTGLYNADRIVEVAAVTVDVNGEIIGEWDTLVDPQRDVGPTHIHGVTASMVSAAPRFEDVAAALADRLYGAVLVAHNVSFDARMLANEYSRIDASLSAGSGLCTLRLGGGKLEDVCRGHQIQLQHAHRALGDARATAQLLTCIAVDRIDPCSCARVFGVSVPYGARTLRREMTGTDVVPMPYLARLASQLHHYGENGAGLAYLDLLDRAVTDLVITDEERTELFDLATDLGLQSGEIERLHRRYLEELVVAAARDRLVTDEECELLRRVAVALGIEPETVIDGVEAWRPTAASVHLHTGMRACFTGSATYPDGSELPRSRLEQVAVERGLEPTRSVTKSGCDILVAADPTSGSGKANNARKYGIPIAAVHDFLLAQPGGAVPVVSSG